MIGSYYQQYTYWPLKFAPKTAVLVAIWPKTAFFVSQLPSRTRLIRGEANILGVAKNFAHALRAA